MFFISLTKYIHQEKSVYGLTSIDNDFFELGRRHGVGGSVDKQTKASQLKVDYFNCMYRYLNGIILVNEVKDLFDKNKISFFIVKGPINANYSSDFFLRNMGDVDIIVHPEDFKIVTLVLSISGSCICFNCFHEESVA